MPRSLTLPPLVSAVLLVLSALVVFPFVLGHAASLGALLKDVTIAPSASLGSWTTYGALLLALLIVYGIRRALSSSRGIRVTDTWDCGTPLTPRMQYTATGFSAPIRFFFRSLVLARKELVAHPVVETNPWIARHELSWGTDSFWEVWLYRPIGKATLAFATLARRLQNGAVQFYLLLVLVALVAVILFAL